MHSHFKLMLLILSVTHSLYAMDLFDFNQEIRPTINPALLNSYSIIKQEDVEPPLEPLFPPLIAPVIDTITTVKHSTGSHKATVLFKDVITDKLEKLSVDETDDKFIVLDNYNSKKCTKMSATKQFACDQCSKSYNSQYYLNRHIRTAHSNDRPYSCYLCKKTFKEKHHCVEHVERHRATRVQCSECSKFFKRNSECTRHLKEVHHIENNYE